MERFMELSIIIPVYNTENYLAECLDSVLNQKLKSYEVIIINDGSTDRSIDIINKYEKNYPEIIRIIDQKNAGLSAARNVGLEIARGEYVYFMDSDDYLVPDSLCNVLYLAKFQKLDVIFFSFKNICEEGLKTQYGHMEIGQKRHMPDTEILSGTELFCQFVKQNEYYVNVWLQIIRKNFLEEYSIKFINGIIFEDRIFTYLLLLYSHKVRCLNKVYYCKRIRENSICVSQKGFAYFYSYIVTLREMFLKIAEINETNSEFRELSICIWNDMNKNLKKFFSNIDSITKVNYVSKLSPKDRLFFEELLFM